MPSPPPGYSKSYIDPATSYMDFVEYLVSRGYQPKEAQTFADNLWQPDNQAGRDAHAKLIAGARALTAAKRAQPPGPFDYAHSWTSQTGEGTRPLPIPDSAHRDVYHRWLQAKQAAGVPLAPGSMPTPTSPAATAAIAKFGADKINSLAMSTGIHPTVAAQIVGQLYSPHLQAMQAAGSDAALHVEAPSGPAELVGNGISSAADAVGDY